MVGVKRTALAPGELITAVTVPVLAGYQGFAKVGVRNAMVISVASACLVVDRAGRTVRLALGAVGPTIVRARQSEAWVAGELPWDGGPLEPGVGRRARPPCRRGGPADRRPPLHGRLPPPRHLGPRRAPAACERAFAA